MANATSHDVARAAGVSQPTVSRALRGDKRLSEATRQRVIAAANALGYVPSQRGRSLATQSTGQIGIVVSDLNNSFYLEVLDAVHESLRAADLRMLVLTPDSRNSLPLEMLVNGSLDGAILTTTLLDSPLPAELSARQFPYVLLNREVDDCPGDACVVDSIAGAKLIAEELLRLGHKRIGAIFGPADTSTGRDRECSFRAALTAAGQPISEDCWRRSPFDVDSGRDATFELLKTTGNSPAGRPTALFCANDMIALGAFNALRRLELAMPEDITLIGFDDVQLAGWAVFELTTVRQDVPRMAQAAVDLLLSRIAAGDEPPPRRVVLPAELIRRSTHGPPPTG